MLKQELEKVIELDRKMKPMRNRKSPYDVKTRRAFESENSCFIEFYFRSKHYKVIQETNCEFEHIYYSVTIFENGVAARKGIRFLEDVLKAVA